MVEIISYFIPVSKVVLVLCTVELCFCIKGPGYQVRVFVEPVARIYLNCSNQFLFPRLPLDFILYYLCDFSYLRQMTVLVGNCGRIELRTLGG